MIYGIQVKKINTSRNERCHAGESPALLSPMQGRKLKLVQSCERVREVVVGDREAMGGLAARNILCYSKM